MVEYYHPCFRSALHYAARYDEVEILKELLAHNASVLVKNVYEM